MSPRGVTTSLQGYIIVSFLMYGDVNEKYSV